MTTKLTAIFSFCGEDARFQGAAEVTRGEYDDRSVVGVQLRVGSTIVRLPRSRLREVIVALENANAEASRQYNCLLKELNDNGLQEEDAEGLQG
mgnify:CR=1 FL=1